MATFDARKNFAYSTIATAPSPAISGTSLVVQGGDGTKFPAVPFNAVIWPTGVNPTAANAEIVRVTAISTDTFTITRAQESSSARTVIVGDQIAQVLTNKTLADIEALFPTGTVVGTTDAQSVSNKVLSDEFMGDVFDSQSATKRDVVLLASTDFIALGLIEVGAANVLEIPATSTLEIMAFIEQSSTAATGLMPAGMIQMYGGATAPTGWLLCDGSNVSRTTYAVLFAAIGTNFGVGDGSTTFTLPDMRGRSPMGVGTGTASGATAHTIGQTPTTGAGGEEAHAQTLGEMAAHAHTINVSGVAGSTIPLAGGGAVGATNPTSSAGSGTAANILHPITVVNFVIKT